VAPTGSRSGCAAGALSHSEASAPWRRGLHVGKILRAIADQLVPYPIYPSSRHLRRRRANHSRGACGYRIVLISKPNFRMSGLKGTQICGVLSAKPGLIFLAINAVFAEVSSTSRGLQLTDVHKMNCYTAVTARKDQARYTSEVLWTSPAT
jgi:hypothetical protein